MNLNQKQTGHLCGWLGTNHYAIFLSFFLGAQKNGPVLASHVLQFIFFFPVKVDAL